MTSPHLYKTWIYQAGFQSHHVFDLEQADQLKSIVDTVCSSFGKRLMILHAGSENGFMSGLGRVFSTNSKNEDYHDIPQIF